MSSATLDYTGSFKTNCLQTRKLIVYFAGIPAFLHVTHKSAELQLKLRQTMHINNPTVYIDSCRSREKETSRKNKPRRFATDSIFLFHRNHFAAQTRIVTLLAARNHIPDFQNGASLLSKNASRRNATRNTNAKQNFT